MSNGKVVNLRTGAGAHEPPEGWDVRGRFGFMEFDSGADDGRLARLGDVLRWLEGVRVLPRSKALDVLMAGLPDDAAEWVYMLKPGAYGEKLPAGYMFGYHTQSQHEEAVRAHNIRPWSGLGSAEWRSEFPEEGPRPTYEGPKVSEPGLPVLRLLMSERWGDEKRWVPRKREWVNTTDFEGGSWAVNCLAVPLAKAAEWWGYGRVTAEPAKPSQSPAAAPEGPYQCEWDGKQLAKRLAQLKADGKGKPTQRLVSESGVPEREIRRRVAAVKSAGSIGGVAATLAKG